MYPFVSTTCRTGLPTKRVQEIADYCSRHQLPESFQQVAVDHYLPLAQHLLASKPARKPLLLGINGAQGTGKSTLADFLQEAITSRSDWNVAVLSIDDFYYTRQERAELATTIHPLLQVRGVPGTHDTALLGQCLDALRNQKNGESLALPRFDKASDDRLDQSSWPQVSGPIDLIILEGWCVGSCPQENSELRAPINVLERIEDAAGEWRRYVNDKLCNEYSTIFDQIGMLIFLKAPDFDSIFRWRLQQETQLETRMTENEVRHFIEYFERLTRANLEVLPGKADVIYELDTSHLIKTVVHAHV